MGELNLNGEQISFDLDGQTPLLTILRDHLHLFGTRYGCGEEQCGSCMVLVDGRPSYGCTRTLDSIAGKDVVTVEGLGNSQTPHPLQRAFLAEQAGQCGFCLSGMLISAAALLKSNPAPDDRDVREALNGNLCRCGAHNRIVRAVLRAASEIAASKINGTSINGPS
jgi:nicotinate dehydrogenase subunit A